MAWKGGYGGKKSMNRGFSEPTKRLRLSDVEKFTSVDLPDRGLRKETLDFLGIKVELSPEDGMTPIAYYFPYYDQRGKLSGYKCKNLLINKGEHGHYTAIGKVGVDCQLFGQKEAMSGNSKSIIFVEGEFDVASAVQAQLDSIKGTKYEGKITPKVVGLSCGTANAIEAVTHNEYFFEGSQKIILGFDQDESTPIEKKKGIKKGKEATEDVASVLMKSNLYTVDYSNNYKDPSDYLQAGDSKALSKLLTWDSKRFVADKVISTKTIGFEELISQKPEGVYVPTFPSLMSKIKGLRKSELVVMTSLSGAGKSSYMSEMAYHLAHNHKVGMIFLEEESKETAQRMMARYLEVNYNLFKFNPIKYADIDKLKEAYEWVDGESIDVDDSGEESTTNRFVYLDHFGSLKVTELMAKIKYLTYVCKCDYIILDHLTLVVSGSGGNASNQTAELDLVMTELAAFVASNDVGIFAISHLNRSAADEIRGISNLEEPKWICVKKEDMRGSSSLEALSWIVLGIDLEIMPDRTRGRTRLTVLKNRPFGSLGEADVCKMNDQTGLLENASDLNNLEI